MIKTLSKERETRTRSSSSKRSTHAISYICIKNRVFHIFTCEIMKDRCVVAFGPKRRGEKVLAVISNARYEKQMERKDFHRFLLSFSFDLRFIRYMMFNIEMTFRRRIKTVAMLRKTIIVTPTR